jgi:1-deoxy-D-xylulose-5-phosphate synthase
VERFPRRAFDVGIAEQHAVTLAAGLAAGGMRPVVAIYSTFLQRAYDQVLHDVCLQGLPVVFALDRAGLVGEDGPTHHGAFDLAYLRHMPRVVVAVPRDGAALRGLLQVALAHDGPFALRYPRGKIPATPVPALDPAAPATPAAATIGTGELLRDGDDLAILAVGPVVYQALEAAQLLAEQGLSIAVADARYVRPLDTDLVLGLAQRTRRLLTVEDGVAAGGFGSAVLEALAAAAGPAAPADCKVRVLGLPDEPLPHGAVSCQLRACGLDAQGIYSAALDLVGR